MKITKQQFKDVADELNKLLFDPPELDGDLPADELIPILKEAFLLIKPEDVISEETMQVIAELTKDEDVNESLPELPTLMQEVENADNIAELKRIAKSNIEFKAIRGNLASYKIEALREAMVALLSIPAESPQDVAERLHEKNIEKAPINKGKKTVEPAPVPEELPEEVKPETKMKLVSDIKTEAPFNELFLINQTLLEIIAKDMVDFGYDPAFPLVLWKGRGIVVDGHTRLEAAKLANIDLVPVEEKEFIDEEDALEYAIHNQRDRRNLSESELLSFVEAIDKKMTKAEAGAKGGKAHAEKTEDKPAEKKPSQPSHEKTAKALGISKSKVSEARTVLKDKKAREAVDSGKKSISAAAKEVREKKSVKKEKTTTPKLTRIESVVKTLADYPIGKKVIVKTLVKDSDARFVTNGGKSSMKDAQVNTEIVLQVLKAWGSIEFITPEEFKILD